MKIGGDRHDFDRAEFSDLSIDDPEIESYMFGDEKYEEYGLVTELVPNAWGICSLVKGLLPNRELCIFLWALLFFYQ